jgi:hypothetical protein
MHITKEHALSGRSSCRYCSELIPVHAPRAKIRREYEPGKARVIVDMYCKFCAMKKIQTEIDSLKRELYEMEVYR